jgi:hypothetical protein
MSMKDVHALRACNDKNKKLLKSHLVLFGVQVRVGLGAMGRVNYLFNSGLSTTEWAASSITMQ